MEDTYLHKGKRRILVEYLRERVGIRDERVLSAINSVPRHFFLESIFEDFAYEDRAFTIASGQTISHPSTVAEQTQLLNRDGKWLSNIHFGSNEGGSLHDRETKRIV